jgi:hypothetical protein
MSQTVFDNPGALSALSIDGIRLSDWIEPSGINRSTAYELIKILKIEPEPRRVIDSHRPVSFHSSAQQQQLEPLSQALLNGTTMSQIRKQLEQSRTVSAITLKSSQIVQHIDLEASQTIPNSTDPLKP